MVFLLGLALAGACGGGTVVAASSYGTSCENDGECTAVFLGDVCTPCGCPNGGIATSGRTQYEADVARLKAQCGPIDAVACKPCQPFRGLCTNRTCATRPE